MPQSVSLRNLAAAQTGPHTRLRGRRVLLFLVVPPVPSLQVVVDCVGERHNAMNQLTLLTRRAKIAHVLGRRHHKLGASDPELAATRQPGSEFQRFSHQRLNQILVRRKGNLFGLDVQIELVFALL